MRTLQRPTPPQSPPAFDITPQRLLQETQEIIDASNGLQDRLASSVTVDTATFENLLLPLLHDDHEAAKKICIFRLFSSVSEDSELRDASRKAEKLRAKANAASLMRRDVAELIAAVFQSHQTGKQVLDAESAYKLFKTHRAYQNAGAGIHDEELRSQYMEAVEEHSKILVEAKKTLSETDEGVWLPREELDGVPLETLDTMEKRDDDQSLKVTFKKGHWTPVMKHAKSSKTRKNLYIARQNRFPEHVERLERIVVLRDDIARMLGFTSHAALKMEDKMADSVDEVLSRLNNLRSKLGSLAKVEVETLLAVKTRQADGRCDGDDPADIDRLNAWDWSFYARILEKENYCIDSQLISEYFEVEHSLKGMLQIFEHLFGMQFTAIEAPTWQKDVTVYEAWDSVDGGGQFLGYLYLDLFARDGKFHGAHCSLIQPGFTKEDETRHYPASSLICSFIRSAGRPTLLQHFELKTMFHELGHAIHMLVTRSKYYHGCARDFVEIPSILLENWIWMPNVLTRIGRHYSYLGPAYKSHWLRRAEEEQRDVEPPETLPMQLAQDLAKTKHVNGAHAMLHQVFLALFDLTIHNPSTREDAREMDTTDLWNRSKADVTGLCSVDGIGQASFGHPFRGYDASYFTYALSRVYATDIWASAFKADPMDRETGLRYRRTVLEPGGGQPEGNLLKAFLGREPSDEAYHDELATAMA